jgi:hypothetical protein
MTWPTEDAPTGNLDAGTDKPALARADLLKAVQNCNQMRTHPSTQSINLMAADDPAEARSIIGAQAQDGKLDAIAALATMAADEYIYFTAANAAAKGVVTAASRALLAGNTSTDQLAVLGVVLNDLMSATEAYLAFATKAEVSAGYRVDIQVLSTPGTFTGTNGYAKPVGARTFDLLVLPGSGGGASGRRGAAGSARYGGGPAGQQPMLWAQGLLASMLGAYTDYTVGAPGVGGAKVTTDNTDGNDGTDGGLSKFGSMFQALGGKGGKKGTNASGLGGVVQYQAISHINGTSGTDAAAGADAVLAAPTAYTQTSALQPTRPGHGGGINASNTKFDGQNGQGIYNQTIQNHPANGAAGGGIGAAGADGTKMDLGGGREFYLGGGGGGPDGGDGGFPGAGGGASTNGTQSGKGGNGVSGRIVVIMHCGV